LHSKSSLLRNIRTSGGLFTENILLRLRDNPYQFEIGKISSFIKSDTENERRKFKDKQKAVFEWCIQKWDEISPKIEDWTLNDLIEKWLIPFFTQFDYKIENFILNEENIDDDSPLKNFKINFQSKDHKNPFFHFVNINEDFNSKIDYNPQNKSHHDVCQQFININPEIKWLFLSNGRFIRLLTKYYHSYSKGFLEFDLENIFANRDLKEFYVLYSIIHKSRFTLDSKKSFLIDIFHQQSIKEGIKIGDALRDNVHAAIELLGNGLIQRNINFLKKLHSHEVELQDFYAELLRIIYRIIFILYAEQREMLPGAGTLYFEQFSLSSIRMLAEKPIKLDNNTDLWNKLFITFNLVKDGNEFLEIPAYNGSLFKNDNLSTILENNLTIPNDILLRVIKLLTTTKDKKLLQRINFLEISEEEIGSIYESLLDFKPYLTSGSQFQLIYQTTERKSTGSYYTPKELIDILIRTTLQPLIEDRISKISNDKLAMEKEILNLKICDPACGGGTFLLAALDFIGKKLAEIRTGMNNPPENDLRQARRDVLQHCIYGVDKNPLAVELTKISLWLRACVKDKPLNFLDNHIKFGNSLIGLGQKSNINNINPNAFKAIDGNKTTGIPPENKILQNEARKKIRKEIEEQKKAKGRITRITKFIMKEETVDIYSKEFQNLINLSEDTPSLINEKEKKYRSLINNPKYLQALKEANIWTSTYFWPFEGKSLGLFPNHLLIEELRNGRQTNQIVTLLKKINSISENYQFFHWYIEFPEVFSSDRKGFDCILTNPPWETLQLKEMEFFTGLNDEILKASNQSKRRELIKGLIKKNPKLYNNYKNAWQSIKKISHFLTNSGFYNLSAKGTINTYALFVERCWRLISPNGYVGLIVPTGIIMNFHLQDLFRTLVNNNAILSMFDFENRNKLFAIDSRFRFCLLSLGGNNISQEIIPMMFYTKDPKEIQEPLSIIFKNKENLKEKVKKLSDNHPLIPLEQEDFKLFNPNTITCPSLRIKKDAELLRHLYKQAPILIKRDFKTNNIISNQWEINFKRMFDSSNDSELFLSKNELKKRNAYQIKNKNIGNIWIDEDNNKYYPLYEGRMIWHYNHRLNSMSFSKEGLKRKAISIESTIEQYNDPNFYITPNYWVKEDDFLNRINSDYKYEWFIGFRDITGSTNERTFISTIIPKTATVNTLPLILSKRSSVEICLLLANLNSIIFDYIVRLKISGQHIKFFIFEQLPIFQPNFYNKNLKKLIIERVLKLCYTSYELTFFAKDLEYYEKPFKWNYDLRFSFQSELDAIYAHLYNINKKDLNYILETFPVLKKNENKKFGEFKTKRLILEAYDKFADQKELFE